MAEFNLVAQDVLQDVTDITEQQIRHWIVSPFLVSLGWDPHDKKQVFLDFPVKGDGPPADYALLDVQGNPRLVIEVRKPGDGVADATSAVAKAKSLNSPLVLLTSGREFSLWFVNPSDPPTPLLLLGLKELEENAESLLGLTADYRLSETGINQLRKSAIRSAVLQMLEENAEKTFDAMVDWVQSQVAPGALDEITDNAIREATMLWLSEEHHTLPAFAPADDAKKHHELRSTSPRDWETFPRGPPGTFQYRFDTSKTLDVRQGPKDVKSALRQQGLRTPTSTSFGGFYYSLRHRAGLGPAKKD